MILDILIIIAWVVGGAYAAKRTLANRERYYLELAHRAGRPQNHMDLDDWAGAIVCAAAVFIAFPAVAGVWLLSYPARWLYRPTRAYMLPPAQAKFEEHVRDLNAQKAIVMNSVKIYQDTLKWKPDDDTERVATLHQLQKIITEQMEELMRIHDPNNPTGFDGDYLQAVKGEVKAITAGAA